MSVESGTNPYASPPRADDAPRGPVKKERGCQFGPIVRRWERLRLIYNGVLTTIVLLLTIFNFPRHLTDLGFWGAVMIGALIANLCFFTGPAIEGYGTCFRLWHPALTVLLFLAGLALATVLAIVSVALFPGVSAIR